jgi:hypothetical protein
MPSPGTAPHTVFGLGFAVWLNAIPSIEVASIRFRIVRNEQ